MSRGYQKPNYVLYYPSSVLNTSRDNNPTSLRNVTKKRFFHEKQRKSNSSIFYQTSHNSINKNEADDKKFGKRRLPLSNDKFSHLVCCSTPCKCTSCSAFNQKIRYIPAYSTIAKKNNIIVPDGDCESVLNQRPKPVIYRATTKENILAWEIKDQKTIDSENLLRKRNDAKVNNFIYRGVAEIGERTNGSDGVFRKKKTHSKAIENLRSSIFEPASTIISKGKKRPPPNTLISNLQSNMTPVSDTAIGHKTISRYQVNDDFMTSITMATNSARGKKQFTEQKKMQEMRAHELPIMHFKKKFENPPTNHSNEITYRSGKKLVNYPWTIRHSNNIFF